MHPSLSTASQTQNTAVKMSSHDFQHDSEQDSPDALSLTPSIHSKAKCLKAISNPATEEQQEQWIQREQNYMSTFLPQEACVPAEVRAMIMDVLLDISALPSSDNSSADTKAFILVGDRKTHQRIILQMTSGLMRSCKMLRHELIQKLYTQHEFLFDEIEDKLSKQWHFPALVEWHAGLSTFMRSMVRHVHLRFWPAFNHNLVEPAALEVLASLPSLEKVTLTDCQTMPENIESLVGSDWSYWTVQVLFRIATSCPKLSGIYYETSPSHGQPDYLRNFRVCGEGYLARMEETEYDLDHEWFAWSAWLDSNPDVDPEFAEADIEDMDAEWWVSCSFNDHATILETEECRRLMLE